ncbi:MULTISPECIES: hypothetical protein [Streptomyces]|uniref:hypothetical protein n=1 Tax=Streptomyces TaxID=1883 RepID=UPI0006AF7521|nr:MULTISPECIES: hypothetical protein [unclassified Streptomyces]KOU80160.1 hypothetical protein ADK94_29790 [Streptomyces sp. XY593]QNE25338.1 hypothetical protein F1D59_11625 [Streptomyces sp. INR7]RSS90701.1 hypothetical protein EF904_31405 [Streptomyces sp. WAC05950]
MVRGLWQQVEQRDPFPVRDPDPADPTCDVCAALVVQRAEGYRQRDLSAVVDCNVEIRQHPHPEVRR